MSLQQEAVQDISAAFSDRARRWVIGFSGGKDSSAVLKLAWMALQAGASPAQEVLIVYCDTGVEIPVIGDYVANTMRQLQAEARAAGLPLKTVVAEPEINDRFFVKVIGRGYPTPTNKFRWCTDRLRINPVQRILKATGPMDAVVMLGIRNNESAERDRVLTEYRKGDSKYFRQSGAGATEVFAPILDFEVIDVWTTLTSGGPPSAIDGTQLAALYRQASGECPIVRDPSGSACAQGRFGCWTCTVVRKDRAVEGLVSEGHGALEPLLKYRNWMATARDHRPYRCKRRRNGAAGVGPLTLSARREFLRRLLHAERLSGMRLIKPEELQRIRELWQADRRDPMYPENLKAH